MWSFFQDLRDHRGDFEATLQKPCQTSLSLLCILVAPAVIVVLAGDFFLITPQTAHTSCPLREPPASLQALALTLRHTWWFSLLLRLLVQGAGSGSQLSSLQELDSEPFFLQIVTEGCEPAWEHTVAQLLRAPWRWRSLCLSSSLGKCWEQLQSF